MSAAPSVLWAETPTNPLLRVAGLAKLARLATAAGAPMVVDNTTATAVLQRGRLGVLAYQGGAEAADMVVAGSHLILPATSFGGVASTWECRARWAGETAPDGLIRLSVGVEAFGLHDVVHGRHATGPVRGASDPYGELREQPLLAKGSDQQRTRAWGPADPVLADEVAGEGLAERARQGWAAFGPVQARTQEGAAAQAEGVDVEAEAVKPTLALVGEFPAAVGRRDDAVAGEGVGERHAEPASKAVVAGAGAPQRLDPGDLLEPGFAVIAGAAGRDPHRGGRRCWPRSPPGRARPPTRRTRWAPG